MTPREKILRDRIEDTKSFCLDRFYIFNGDNPKRRKLVNDHDIRDMFEGLYRNSKTAIEQADAIKGGLSQEDLDKIEPARTERLSKSFDDPNPKVKAGPSEEEREYILIELQYMLDCEENPCGICKKSVRQTASLLRHAWE